MTNQKILDRCDQIMAAAMYAMICFLPVSSAIIEICFVVALIAYFYKRAAVYLDLQRSGKDPSKAFSLFLRTFQPVESPLNKPIGIFVFCSFLSVLLSLYFPLSMKSFVFKLLEAVYFYFILIEVINSRKRLDTFISVMLFSALIIVVDGVFQYFVRTDFIHGHPVTDGRVTSAFKHANDLAAYLVGVLPVFFVFSPFFSLQFKGKETGGESFFLSPGFKVVAGLIFLLGVFCIGVTFSRSAWIALIVGFVFLCRKNKKILFPMILFSTVFLFFFSYKLLHERTLGDLQLKTILNGSGRWTFWQEAMNIIKDYPIFGAGLNTYSLVGKGYKIAWGGYPHNCYLQMAAEIGIVGLLSFLWVLYSAFKYINGNIFKIRIPSLSFLLAGLWSGFLGFLFVGFFDTSFYSNQLGNFLWVILGVMVAVSQLAQKSEG